MAWAPPTPEEQVLFLRNIQRLLAEGQFTASYKFALLLALADLCVLKGDDSGDPLELTIHDIAEKFIDLYWQQCRPFEMGGQTTGVILQQNTGKQAAVISGIIEAHRKCGGSLFRLRYSAPDHWHSLVCDVRQVVSVMPLWKLVARWKPSYLLRWSSPQESVWQHRVRRRSRRSNFLQP